MRSYYENSESTPPLPKPHPFYYAAATPQSYKPLPYDKLLFCLSTSSLLNMNISSHTPRQAQIAKYMFVFIASHSCQA